MAKPAASSEGSPASRAASRMRRTMGRNGRVTPRGANKAPSRVRTSSRSTSRRRSAPSMSKMTRPTWSPGNAVGVVLDDLARLAGRQAQREALADAELAVHQGDGDVAGLDLEVADGRRLAGVLAIDEHAARRLGAER